LIELIINSISSAVIEIW